MYELKAGQGTIFKNSKKENEKHPDYRGEILTPDGIKYEISLWVKEGKSGKFFSCSIKEPYVKPEVKEKPVSKVNPDDMPF